MGKITAGNWSYVLSSADKLWAARMAQYEGGDVAATLWTMTQAYAQPAIHRAYGTFASFIQAYSQPINPIWRLGGSRCPTASSDSTDPCFTARLERRERAARMAFSETDLAVQEAVTDWDAGVLHNPVPKAVDFADDRVGQNFIDSHAGSRAVLRAGGNVYIATRSSLQWPDAWVTMGATGLGLVAIIAIGVVGGVGAYYLHRRWKMRRGTMLLGTRLDVQTELDDVVHRLDHAWGDLRFSITEISDLHTDRAGNPVTVLTGPVDCGHMEQQIATVEKRKALFASAIFSRDPEEFDSVQINAWMINGKQWLTPEIVEEIEEKADRVVDDARRVMRAAGC